MLEKLNRVFIAFLLFCAILGMLLSAIALFVPGILSGNTELENLAGTGYREDFSLYRVQETVRADDSPYILNVSIRTPPLESDDLVFLDVYGNGERLYLIDCLGSFESPSEYVGYREFLCEAYLPYRYERGSTYRVFGILTRDGKEYATLPITIDADWRQYEGSFAGFSATMLIALGASYVILLLPLTYALIRISMGTKRIESRPGEYSLRSLTHPLDGAKTLLQKFHAILVSPYFWLLQAIAVLVIILYMVGTAEAWKSGPAAIGFILSGLAAFIVPYLWCCAWWYADFREREPLRILVTLFLWGMMAALMVIGINSLAGDVFAVLGLGFLSVFIVAPVMEEFFKGAGLTLFSEHHEYNSVEDGFVFGFVIGMGFSFIEDWIYFLGNPIGSDPLSWGLVFILRSIFFSANHGFYTAITGGAIGWLIEKKHRAPALGLLVGFPIAAFFHAMHNSGEAIITFLGAGGALLYCCFLVPLFDYGGFILLIALFVRSVMRPKAG
ncbi:MAG: PrsW family intramembrane metalloprotease [Candidatus Micrarchaeota archaeon]